MIGIIKCSKQGKTFSQGHQAEIAIPLEAIYPVLLFSFVAQSKKDATFTVVSREEGFKKKRILTESDCASLICQNWI